MSSVDTIPRQLREDEDRRLDDNATSPSPTPAPGPGEVFREILGPDGNATTTTTNTSTTTSTPTDCPIGDVANRAEFPCADSWSTAPIVPMGANCTTQCALGFEPDPPWLICLYAYQGGGLMHAPSGNTTYACIPMPSCPNPVSAFIVDSNTTSTCFESEDTKSVLHGSNCTTQCKLYYKSIPALLTCTNGTMNQSMFDCYEEYDVPWEHVVTNPTSTTPAPPAPTGAYIGASVGVLALIGLGLLIYYVATKRRSKKRRDWADYNNDGGVQYDANMNLKTFGAKNANARPKDAILDYKPGRKPFRGLRKGRF